MMMFRADELLRQAASVIGERGKQRDTPDGERSMQRAVRMFNALVGGDARITELEGWLFMCCLKMARSTAGKLNVDDYVDLAGYAGLAAECAAYGVPLDEVPRTEPIDITTAVSYCRCARPAPFIDACARCGGRIEE